MTITETSKPTDNPRIFQVDCQSNENPLDIPKTAYLEIGSRHPTDHELFLHTYTVTYRPPPRKWLLWRDRKRSRWTVEAYYSTKPPGWNEAANYLATEPPTREELIAMAHLLHDRRTEMKCGFIPITPEPQDWNMTPLTTDEWIVIKDFIRDRRAEQKRCGLGPYAQKNGNHETNHNTTNL